MFRRLILSSFLAAITWPSLSAASMHADCHQRAGFPASYELFSSEFQQPKPPIVKSEFKTHWKQHAWYDPSPTYNKLCNFFISLDQSNAKLLLGLLTSRILHRAISTIRLATRKYEWMQLLIRISRLLYSTTGMYHPEGWFLTPCIF